MRIAELSSRSGTSIPSIKFYLREGLLPAGESTGRNQADYGDTHLYRLRLIRALMDVGGLSVAAAREVLSAVDTPDLPGHALLGAAAYSIAKPAKRDPDRSDWQAARRDVLSRLQARGWLVDENASALDQAADAVLTYRELGQDDLLACFDRYADVCETIGEYEVGLVVAREDPARMVEGVITGTIIGEVLLTALRRLAQQNASAKLLGIPLQ